MPLATQIEKALRPNRPATRPAKAAESPRQEYNFEVSGEFPVFGRNTGSPVHVATEASTHALAKWLAFNESRRETDESRWEKCIQQNPTCFSSLQPIDLFDSSLDLPRGTVIFSTIEAPPMIKDDPPGEILDRLAAVRDRHPEAKIWLHEPVYRHGEGDDAPALLTLEQLHEQAARAKQAVWDDYRKSRSRFRADYHLRTIERLMQKLQLTLHNHLILGTSLSLAAAAVPVILVASVALLPGLVVIDPILTFTLPGDDGRHWFIGHWDWRESPSGMKTLVYI